MPTPTFEKENLCVKWYLTREIDIFGRTPEAESFENSRITLPPRDAPKTLTPLKDFPLLHQAFMVLMRSANSPILALRLFVYWLGSNISLILASTFTAIARHPK